MSRPSGKFATAIVGVLVFFSGTVGVLQYVARFGSAQVVALARAGSTLILHERRGGGAPRGAGTTDRLVALEASTGNVLARTVVERGLLVGAANGSVFWLRDVGLEARAADALETTLSAEESLVRIPELVGALEPCRELDAAAFRFRAPSGAAYRVSLSELRALKVSSAACQAGSTTASAAGKVDPAWLEPRSVLIAGADGARIPLELGVDAIVVHESALGPTGTSLVALVSVSGEARWNTKLPWASLQPSEVHLFDGALVLAGQGKAAAINPDSGALLWTRAP